MDTITLQPGNPDDSTAKPTLYCPAHFTQHTLDWRWLVQRFPLAQLIMNGQGDHAVPQCYPVPVTLLGEHLFCHLARNNPLTAQLVSGQPLLLTIQGSQSYISPNYYGSAEQHQQVPTWHYCYGQLQVTLEWQDQPEQCREILAAQTAYFEQHQATPWQLSKLPEAKLAQMLNHIRFAKLHVQHSELKFKWAQNKSLALQQQLKQALQALSQSAQQATQQPAHQPWQNAEFARQQQALAAAQWLTLLAEIEQFN